MVLAIPNGRRYVELPAVREMDELARDFRGAPLEPLFDLPAAHLVDLMGFEPLAVTQAAFGAGKMAYLGDACGPIGALAPGRGMLDVGAIASRLESRPQIVFSPWTGLDENEVIEAVSAMVREVCVA